jgi:hypothetical protein
MQRLKAQEQEGLAQLCTIWAIFADAQDDTVTVQFLLGEFQEGEEGLLGRFLGHLAGQGHVQDVVVVVQDLEFLMWKLISKIISSLSNFFWKPYKFPFTFFVKSPQFHFENFL